MSVYFDKIFASEGLTYSLSDDENNQGFEFLNGLPPSLELFNGLFKNSDLKSQQLNNIKTDIETLAESTGYGVISGCEILAQDTPDMTVKFGTLGTNRVHMPSGKPYTLSSVSSLPIDTADATNPRIDSIYIDISESITYAVGTPAASPSTPTLPTGCLSVASIAVAAGATSITDSDITDLRVYKNKFDYNQIGSINVMYPPAPFVGAKGDGVTDDTAAIKAITVYANGKEVFFPDGEYLINPVTYYGVLNYGTPAIPTDFALIFNVPVKWRGHNATIIVDNDTAGGLDTIWKNGIACTKYSEFNGIIFKMKNLEPYSGRHLHFVGTSTEKTGFKLTNCTFVGGYQQIALYDYIDGVIIEDCIFDNTVGKGGYGIYADDCRWCKNIHINRNKFMGSPKGDAIEFNNDGHTIAIGDTNKTQRNIAAGEYTENVYITNNYITGYTSTEAAAGLGIGFAGKMNNIVIENNVITDCYANCIHFEYLYLRQNDIPTNITIDNNVVKILEDAPSSSVGITFTAWPEVVESDVDWSKHQNIIATKNQIVTNNCVGMLWKFVSGIEVSQNKITSSLRSAIQIQGGNNFKIFNNKITDSKTGVSFTGGFGKGKKITINGNTYNNVETAYQLSEYANTVPILVINNNTYIRCLNMLTDINSTGYLLTGYNETVFCGVPVRQAYYKPGSMPCGINYVNHEITVDDNSSLSAYWKIYLMMVGNSVFPGSKVYSTASTTVKTANMHGCIYVGYLNSANVLATTTAGSNVVTVSTASQYLLPGMFISIDGSGLSTTACVIDIDVANKLIYLSENATTAVSNVQITAIQATFS